MLEGSAEYVALLAEGVDRNRFLPFFQPAVPSSPSSRRAWIEIAQVSMMSTVEKVALLAEGVDRNRELPGAGCGLVVVALLAEGVDRNSRAASISFLLWVALLAEGVDRNFSICAL